MSVNFKQPLAIVSSESHLLVIKRIELFIIEELDQKGLGYRVIMHLMTCNEHTWSEFFVDRMRKPADWVSWALGLQRYIGVNSRYNWMNDEHCEESLHSILLQLAAQQLLSSSSVADSRFHNRSFLLERSISYVSLF